MQYRDFARSFDSDLGLREMSVRLNETGPWRWIERDNDQWGFYFYAGVLPRLQRGIVKLYVDDNPRNLNWADVKPSDARFVVEVHLQSDEPNALAIFGEIERTLFERILPACGARDIQETETA